VYDHSIVVVLQGAKESNVAGVISGGVEVCVMREGGEQKEEGRELDEQKANPRLGATSLTTTSIG
jgi:hypothetical protein